MMKKLLFTSLLTFAALHADIIGGEISIGMYSHSPSGTASYTEPYTGLGLGTSADVEDTLHWDSNENVFLKAYIEHPAPMLPNIKLAYTQLSQEGEGNVGDFTWGGIHIPTLGTIENSLDISKYGYGIPDQDRDGGCTHRPRADDNFISRLNTYRTECSNQARGIGVNRHRTFYLKIVLASALKFPNLLPTIKLITPRTKECG